MLRHKLAIAAAGLGLAATLGAAAPAEARTFVSVGVGLPGARLVEEHCALHGGQLLDLGQLLRGFSAAESLVDLQALRVPTLLGKCEVLKTRPAIRSGCAVAIRIPI